jgi:hypothetical protein
MNAIYIILILLQAGILVFFVSRAIKAWRAKNKALPPSLGPYELFRQASLGVTPVQLQLTMSPSVLKVYGVVTDWDLNGTVLTLSTYINGAANAALSNGASITGGGKNPAVAEQASVLVQLAQDFVPRAVPAVAGGVLVPGTVRFYLLTNQGLYAAQELLSSIQEETSPWTPLFFTANLVLSEIKKGEVAEAENV